ncbi:MAG: hypothetical protein COU31_04700 [Candidatus Magasanikbacteria bacterium CG10_big_fil_rev_8_21_14_0_10_40_10]|uniref:Cell division protein FtsX n=1 Tax=Candidatus Magasanikbacteria bacterium CG10_big_fil_rev_8_21_14_0_10_40_10 TaxID=1974648 RepID=A0A2M6W2T1_9BACT|nr:MAG: hypothetical protein COU31_04700 [Candidatus Magasanikbacteria bacterium CG10_big_fil_rev_8_21_14_0_10_40_10]
MKKWGNINYKNMISFLRIIKFAFFDIGRNISLSFMTVFILVLMLLSVNVLWSIDVIAKQAVGSVKKQIDISFYFIPTATQTEVDDIDKYLKAQPEVTEVKVLSATQVLDNFKARHKDEKETINALGELSENPFGPTMIVRAKDPNDYKKIIQAMNVPEYQKIIESQSFDQHEASIEKLNTIIGRIEKIGLGLTILFAIISFLIIFNTIRVSINTQRAEISIKRLVGASNWFIRGPYLIEAIIFTIVSVALTFVIVFVAAGWLDSYLSVIFASNFSLTNYFKSNIFFLGSLQAIAVLLLTVVSSGLAMRRQLKV